MIDELNIELPARPKSRMPLPAEQPAFETLEPHQTVALDGVLCCARALPRLRDDITHIALTPLLSLVRQVTDWTLGSGTEEQRLGDYRFLVLDFKTPSGIDTFVQIWSEPFCNLVIEVGPGNREDAVLLAFANQIRNPLLDRGFEIGGNADNFKKILLSLSKDDPPRVARELLAILMDVLGYDGCADLVYRFHQGCNLRAGHVVNGLNRAALHTLLLSWGLRPTIPEDETDVLDACSLHQHFRVHLFCPQQQRKDHFWEVHCAATLTLSIDKASALIREVNSKPYLFKAFASTDPSDVTQHVRLAMGIDLCGGVTLEHIRSQIYEFLDRIRKLTPTG